MKRFLCLCFCLHICRSDWVSDWMKPIQEQLDDIPPVQKTPPLAVTKQFDEQYEKLAPFEDHTEQEPPVYKSHKNEDTASGLKNKVANTLELAKALVETLRLQILELTSKETKLKDAIANGRSGISTVTVTTTGQNVRSYIIREGTWTLCTGIIQSPASPVLGSYNGLFSTPRCIGQEVPTATDPCVFNSVIKYETIPTQRRILYSEDDYLCLKSSFNATVEQYLSVPRRLINDTCVNGQVRSLEDNYVQCGMRMVSEYSFYPHRSQSNTLPLEYCTEADGSCKLVVAWHVSNATIENFEFLKDEHNFKKYFMRNSFNPLSM